METVEIQGSVVSNIRCKKEVEKSNRYDKEGNPIYRYGSVRLKLDEICLDRLNWDSVDYFLNLQPGIIKSTCIVEVSYKLNCALYPHELGADRAPDADENYELIARLMKEQKVKLICVADKFFLRQNHISEVSAEGKQSLYIKIMGHSSIVPHVEIGVSNHSSTKNISSANAVTQLLFPHINEGATRELNLV